jgi:hypothetical protein
MQVANTAGLAIVFRNPAPQRESGYPGGWTVLAGDHEFKVLVCRDETRRPHVVHKEAA